MSEMSWKKSQNTIDKLASHPSWLSEKRLLHKSHFHRLCLTLFTGVSLSILSGGPTAAQLSESTFAIDDRCDANATIPRPYLEGTFAKPIDALSGKFGYETGAWRVDRHPRFLAFVNNDNRADIVGFGNGGVSVALGQQNGTFSSPDDVITGEFGYESSGNAWRTDRHIRKLADVNGDGHIDIVGFKNGGVFVAKGKGDGGFDEPFYALSNYFGYWQTAGSWNINKHVRELADVNGDGRADIVGFHDDGVLVSLGQPDGSFLTPPINALSGKFGYEAGAWRVDRHPRFLAFVNNDNRADIVGFGNGGVSVALGQQNGTFSSPDDVITGEFGYESNAGGWRTDRHIRELVDIDGDRQIDIVGFNDDGVLVAQGKRGGTFGTPSMVISGKYGFNAGGWRKDQHLRILSRRLIKGPILFGSRTDIVAFGNLGVSISRGTSGTSSALFSTPKDVIVCAYGFDVKAGGWHVDRHPRFLADVTGDGLQDIVAFGNGGVSVAVRLKH